MSLRRPRLDELLAALAGTRRDRLVRGEDMLQLLDLVGAPAPEEASYWPIEFGDLDDDGLPRVDGGPLNSEAEVDRQAFFEVMHPYLDDAAVARGLELLVRLQVG